MPRLLCCALLLLPLAGCGPDAGPPQDDLSERPVRVVVTTSMIADLARQIGGDRVEVEGLMGPGVDPHLYNASEGDVRRMTDADLIFYNGLDLEGKMADLLDRMEDRATAVTDQIDRALLDTPPEYEGSFDPHVWMDVSMWKTAAAAVGGRLAALDSAHAEAYGQRVGAYAAQLDSLDAYVRAEAARVPEGQRVLVTAHDAFGYFGRAYGFEVRGLQGLSTTAEAGTADVQNLARFVAERQILALFVESSVSERSIRAVREAVRARGFEVEIGGNLYSDALGGEGSGADTYVGMIRHNVDTIVGALAGEPVAGR
ncbi:MAG: zinc ABC transporter substrate-binding protein [Bacteroidota bacterium]